MLKKLKKLAKSYIDYLVLKDNISLLKIKKKFYNPKLTPVMVALSWIGSAGFIWYVPALFLLRNKKTRKKGIITIISLAESVVVNTIVTKLFFHRIRPCYRYDNDIKWFTLPVGYSFPSGHAMTSFGALTILTISNPLNIIWALPLAGGIAFSRIYLFAHYPSDIIAGAVDGILSGLLMYSTVNKVSSLKAPYKNHSEKFLC